MKKVTLSTYNKLWKMPFKIYSIDNLKLMVPLNPWDVLVFFICIILMAILGKILFFIKIPFIFKYGIFPLAITKIVDNVKLDGKKTYKYFYDMARFLILPKKYEHFKAFKQDNLKCFDETFLIRRKSNIKYIDSKNPHEIFMKNLNVIKNK